MSKRSIAVALAIFGALGGATPAEAVVRASGELRRVSATRYELVVRNTGDESLRSIAFIAGSGVRPSTAQTSGGDCTLVRNFRGGGDGFICGNFTLDPDRSRVFGFRTPRAYPTGAGGTLLAYEPPEPGRHRSFVIGPAPPAGSKPLAGRSELFEPVRGVVLVRRRGSRRFVRLQRGQLVPDRSEIDTRRGAARITVASDERAGFSTATFSEGRAVIDQNRARRPTTTLSLSEPLACPRLATTTTAAARARKQRQIFVRTKGGRFRTRGNRAAGTASGTAWRTTDTCNTTTIKVTEGTVRVRDFRRRRTLNLTAPDSYTARGSALTGAGVETASAADSVERATNLLEGKRLTVYLAHENRTDSDIQHRIDFCPRGRVFVKSTFYWIARVVRRSRGRWRVVSAEIRRDVGWAEATVTAWPTQPTVRFPPSTGRTFRVVTDRRGVRMLGRGAELTPSPAC